MLKMKKNVLAIVGIVTLLFSLYIVSALYEGEITIGVGEDVIFNIGDPVTFNVTETCTTGQTACSGTNYYLCINNSWVNQGNVNGQCGYSTPSSSSSSGGGGGTTILRSIVTGVNENQTAGTSTTDTSGTEDEEVIPTDKQSSKGFLGITGAAITNFAKSGGGIATGIILVMGLAGGIVFFNFKKGKFVKKNSENKEEQNL